MRSNYVNRETKTKTTTQHKTIIIRVEAQNTNQEIREGNVKEKLKDGETNKRKFCETKRKTKLWIDEKLIFQNRSTQSRSISLRPSIIYVSQSIARAVIRSINLNLRA